MIERSMRPILRLMAILAIAGTFGTFGAPSALAATTTTASNTSTKAVIVPVPSGSTSGRVAAQAGAGRVKICKTLEAGSPDNGAGLFRFSTTGVADVLIDAPATPGQLACALTAPIAAGTRVTVTEAFNNRYIVAPNGIRFQADPAGNATSNVFTQQAFITVVAGQISEVTFVNRFVNSTLKICKELDAFTVAPGRLFRFTVRGTNPSLVYPDVVVRASSCAATRVRAGTVVVQEVVPADFRVTNMAIRAGTGSVDVANGRATLNQVVDQVSEVVFQNGGFGFIQVCKETTGALRSGTFTFTSSAPGFGGTQTINVTAGATQPVCGPLTRLQAGPISITEQASGNTILNGVRTEPTNRNLVVSGRTATFRLPNGTASQQTLVIFDNALRGFIQICKETTPFANGAFFGGTFSFTGNFPRTGIFNQTVTVQAGATQPVCGPLTPVNAGTIVATELVPANAVLTGVRTVGPGNIISRNGNTVNVNVPAGLPGNQTLIIFRNAPR